MSSLYKINRSLIVALCFLFIAAEPKNAIASEEVIVSAAASLTNVMNDMGHAFESEYPEVKIIFNFASSGSLLQQMIYGAPVDVFASANVFFMDRAENESLIFTESKRDFCRNSLIIIIPANKGPESTLANGKPFDIQSISRIDRIALGNPETVPAGRYAKEALKGYGLWDRIQSRLVYAGSVRQVLDYVSRGEVDAGVVYRTDALIAGDKVKCLFTLEHHSSVIYPIAATNSSAHRKNALMFIDFVTNKKGKGILKSHGFEVP